MLDEFLHLYRATKYSLEGLISAFKAEQAFRQECFALLILVFVLAFQEKSFLSWTIVISGWLFVMSLELLNSAIEKSFDLNTQDYRPIIKQGKDMASAAIFIAILINTFIWIYIFILSHNPT